MAWYCSGSTNTELVENLFRVGLIKDERVKNAMIGVSELSILVPPPSLDSTQTKYFVAQIAGIPQQPQQPAVHKATTHATLAITRKNMARTVRN